MLVKAATDVCKILLLKFKYIVTVWLSINVDWFEDCFGIAGIWHGCIIMSRLAVAQNNVVGKLIIDHFTILQ